jgi:nucleoid DNA-binding protein
MFHGARYSNTLFFPLDYASFHRRDSPTNPSHHQERFMAANKKPTSKSEIYAFIAEKTDLKRKDVVGVFEALQSLIERDLKKGPGIFNVVGLMKIKVINKPAVPARKGVNPFTGEEMMFKAKPARNVIKVQALKTLKDMV